MNRPTLRRALDQWLSRRTPLQVAAIAVVVLLAIGAVDHFTGFELALSLFYLLPVALSAWYADSNLSLALCFGCATTWLLVDYTSGNVYSHGAIPYWNAAVRLGFFVVVAQLLVRLRAALSAAESQAQRDGLTGLLNGRAVRERYRLLAGLAGRSGQQLALGYIDIDGFKAVNDTLGHGVGDEVLQAVGATLTGRLRATDIVGRLGGDEFAVVLPQADELAAHCIFDELHAALRTLAAARTWRIGFSIGVGIFATPPAENAAFGFADQLMYGVKKSGGNRVAVQAYEPDENDRSARSSTRSAS